MKKSLSLFLLPMLPMLLSAQESQENVQQLDAVEVSQETKKVESCNPLVVTGVHRMTVEDILRLAGSFEDPMRTAVVTPGVTGQVGDNGISIHGNPPSSVRYHIEGAEIPSPNHFADAMGYGGSFCSSMKVTMLTDWDLFTSAPTAEYGNTLGGVFDYHLRAGNPHQQRFTLKAGVLGLEALAEGPSGSNGASYLVDYRYALTSLAYDMGMIVLNDEMFDFQDFSYKFQIPTRHGGTLSFWALGQLGDHYWTLTKGVDEAETVEDLHRQDCRQNLIMGGVNHDQPLSGNRRLRWTAVASTFRNDNSEAYFARPVAQQTTTLFEDEQQTGQFTLSASLQRRYNCHLLVKSGGQYVQYVFDYRFASRPSLFDEHPLSVAQDGRYLMGLSHFYTEALLDVGKWHFNVGAATQGMTNGKSWSFEPRLSALWQYTAKQSLSLGVARSLQMPSLDNIFYRDETYKGMGEGKHLAMIGSNQLCLTYRYTPSDGLSFTAEAYLDRLDHLPVGIIDKTYCSFNRYLFNQRQPLTSQGKGRNRGITLALDRYLKRGFYYSLNAMLFDNRWKGLDDVWRNTRQNRKWKMSATLGNEWRLGWHRRDVLGLNVSANIMGGLYDTPVFFEETRKNYQNGIPYVAYDSSRALTRQYSPVTLVNASATYRICRSKRCSHLVGLEWMNVLMQSEPWTQRYDFRHDCVVDIATATSLPNLYYQIDF